MFRPFVVAIIVSIAACSSGPASTPPPIVFPEPPGSSGGPIDGGQPGSPKDGGQPGNPSDGGPGGSKDGGPPGNPNDGGLTTDGGLSTNVVDRYTSGTRLQAIWLVAADGAQQFEKWHDTQLNLDCSFAIAADGVLRCLPRNAPLADGNSSGYADSACKQPVAYSDSTCLVPYVLGMDRSVCPSRQHVYSRGSTVPAMHYGNWDGPCTPVDYGGSFYALGPEVPASTFASATYTSGPALGGLTPVYTQGSDGSQGFDHWVDATSASPCSLYEAADQTNRCLPNTDAAGASGLYTDSTCTTPAASTPDVGCGAPAYGTTYGQDPQCGFFLRIFTVGPKLTSSPYAGTTANCTAFKEPGFAFYSPGSEVPPSSFVQVTLQPPSGNTRLQRINFATPGGLVQLSKWYDSSRHENCQLATAADGQVRCIPDQLSGLGNAFRDAACTQPLVLWTTALCGSPAPYVISTDFNVCPPVSHIYPLGAQVTTATFYAGGGTSCTSVTLQSSESLYEVGAEIAPASFEGLVKVPR